MYHHYAKREVLYLIIIHLLRSSRAKIKVYPLFEQELELVMTLRVSVRV